ncbi:unnamed protein product [Choristocarpus tenellus]
MVLVPRCVVTGERVAAAVVQYGHGLFGDRSEIRDGFLGKLAEEGAWVLVSVDWRGMGRLDLPVVARALMARPEMLFGGIAEEMMQVGLSLCVCEGIGYLVVVPGETILKAEGGGVRRDGGMEY